MLNWDDLRHFLAAARAGSLAGAARALDVEHTTIGRRLSALEESLGAAVVLRNPDGLKLTALGRRLVPLAEDMERAALGIADQAGTERSRVRLAIPSGMSQLFAPDFASLGQLTIELVSGSRVVDLGRGEADLAIRLGPISGDDLVVKRLGEVGMALYGSARYLRNRRVDPEDLSKHDVVAFDTSLASLPAARWLEARIKRGRVVVRSREMTDMLAAVNAGLGVGLLPCYMGDYATGLVRLTKDPVASSVLSLVYRREARLAKPVRTVAGFVVASIQRQAGRLSGRNTT